MGRQALGSSNLFVTNHRMTQGQHGLYVELEITLSLMSYMIQTEAGSFSINAPSFLLLSLGI